MMGIYLRARGGGNLCQFFIICFLSIKAGYGPVSAFLLSLSISLLPIAIEDDIEIGSGDIDD